MNKEERLEIYEYDRAIKSILTRIEKNKEISNNNKKHIAKFYEFCSAEGLSKARLEYYLNRFFVIGKLAKKDFKKMNRTDVIALVNQINNLKLSDRSKADYRGGLKKFFKWLKNINERGVYPEEVNWIKANNKSKNNLLPEELLSEDDIKKWLMLQSMSEIKHLFLLYTKAAAE
jgi:site-specific recombinase XerD